MADISDEEDSNIIVVRDKFPESQRCQYINLKCVGLSLLALMLLTSLLANLYLVEKFVLHLPLFNIKPNRPPLEQMSDISKLPFDASLGFLPNSEATEYCSSYHYDVYTTRDKRRKIYDLFMVNSELDLLEIRLGEMYDYVDYFVVVEAPISFSGKPKKLYIKENWERYKPYHNKMILHTLDDNFEDNRNAWFREFGQRNAMYHQVFPSLKGLQEPQQGDVIISSDVDEIPKPKTLVALRNCDFPKTVTLRSNFYYYSFQWRHSGDDWGYPHATYYDGLNTVDPQTLRDKGSEDNIWGAAWHCSFCFRNLAEITQKLQFFSHTEYDKSSYLDRAKILYRVRNGLDLFGSGEGQYYFLPNNQDIPEFIMKNKEKYAYIINRDPPSGNFIDYSPEDSQ